MIRHCVFIHFRADVAETEQQAIFDDIRALQALVPGFLAVHIGDNVSPETDMDKGFSAGLIADFEDAAARDAYLVHPAHQKAGARIVAAAKGGVEGIFVYDIEVAA